MSLPIVNPTALRHVEAADRQLGTSLQQGNGAHFAWLMSMWDSRFQQLDQPEQQESVSPAEIDGYTPELVMDMASMLQNRQSGALALTLSWLNTRPQLASNASAEVDMSLVGLSSQNPLLSEIQQSRQTFSATA